MIRSNFGNLFGLPGMIIDYIGSDEPSGWMFCDGRILLQASYPSLFAALGTSYNIGGEAGTEFRIPDCRDRVCASRDEMGTGDAGRIAAATTRGMTVGTETVALATAELPAHAHTFSVSFFDMNHTHTIAAYTGASKTISSYYVWPNYDLEVYDYSSSYVNMAHTHTAMTFSTPGALGTAHQNLQPLYVCNKIIKL